MVICMIPDTFYNLLWVVQTLNKEMSGWKALWNSPRDPPPPLCPVLVDGFLSQFSDAFMDYRLFDGDLNNPQKIHVFPRGGLFFRHLMNDRWLFHRFPETIVKQCISYAEEDQEDDIPHTEIPIVFVGRRIGWSVTRMLSNMSEIHDAMIHHNIPVIYPEDLSYHHLIRYLQRVRHTVIMPWGSGLTNLIYVPRHVRILIYYHYSYGNEYAVRIFDNILKGRSFEIIFDTEGYLDPTLILNAL